MLATPAYGTLHHVSTFEKIHTCTRVWRLRVLDAVSRPIVQCTAGGRDMYVAVVYNIHVQPT